MLKNENGQRLMENIIPKRLTVFFLEKDGVKECFKDEISTYANNLNDLKRKKEKYLIEKNLFIEFVSGSLAKKNWLAVFNAILETYNEYNVVWNDKCREELKEALRAEIKDCETRLEIDETAIWEWKRFSIYYKTLKEEPFCSGYYLRPLLLLFESTDFDKEDLTKNISTLDELVNRLVDKALVSTKRNEREVCVKLLLSLWKREEKLNLPQYKAKNLLIVARTQPEGTFMDDILTFFENATEKVETSKGFFKEHIFEFFSTLLEEFILLDAQNSEKTLKKEKKKYKIHSNRCLSVLKTIENIVERVNIARLRILSNKIFDILIKMLAVNDKKLVEELINLFEKILSGERKLFPYLAEKGFFLFLMESIHSIGMKDIYVEFLSYHSKQKKNSILTKNDSALKFILPNPIVDYLEELSTEKFVEFFEKGESFNTPEVLWTNEMESKMFDEVSNIIKRYKHQTIENGISDSINFFKTIEPFDYDSDENFILVSGVYVKLWNQNDGSYQLKAPEQFFKSLQSELKINKENEEQLEIIKAMKSVVERYPALESVRNFEGTSEIVKQFLKAEFSDERKISAMNLFIQLADIKNSTENIRSLQSDGVGAICREIIIEYLSNDFSAENELLELSFYLLSTLVDFDKECSLETANEKAFFELLIKLSDSDMKCKNDFFQINAIELIALLCFYSENAIKFVDRGILLDLLVRPIKSSKKNKNLTIAAIKALQTIILNGEKTKRALKKPETESDNKTNNKNPKTSLKSELISLIEEIVPPGIANKLLGNQKQTPIEFIDTLKEKHFTPLLIWNPSDKKELLTAIEDERKTTKENKNWERYNKKNAEISTVKNEIRIVKSGGEEVLFLSGIYLNALDSANGEISKDFYRKIDADVLLKSLCTAFNDYFDEKILKVLIKAICTLMEKFNRFAKSSELKKIFRLKENDKKKFLIALDSLVRLKAIFKIKKDPIKDILLFISDNSLDQNLSEKALDVLKHFLECHKKLASDKINALGGIPMLLFRFGDLGDGEIDREEDLVEFRTEILKLILKVEDKSSGAFFGLLPKSFGKFKRELSEVEICDLVELYDSDVESPVLLWNEMCRGDLLDFLNNEVGEIKKSDLKLFSNTEMVKRYKEKKKFLGTQLVLNGVYVFQYNKNPEFEIDEEEFFEAASEGVKTEFRFYLYTEKEKETESKQIKLKNSLKNLTEIWTSISNLFAKSSKIRSLMLKNKTLVGFFFIHLSVRSFSEDFKLILVELLASMFSHENFKKKFLSKKHFNAVVAFGSRENESESISKNVFNFFLQLQEGSEFYKERECGTLGLLLVFFLLQLDELNGVQEKAAELLFKIYIEKGNFDWLENAKKCLKKSGVEIALNSNIKDLSEQTVIDYFYGLWESEGADKVETVINQLKETFQKVNKKSDS